MIIENEHGQPEMVGAFFTGGLPDEDYEDESDKKQSGLKSSIMEGFQRFTLNRHCGKIQLLCRTKDYKHERERKHESFKGRNHV